MLIVFFVNFQAEKEDTDIDISCDIEAKRKDSDEEYEKDSPDLKKLRPRSNVNYSESRLTTINSSPVVSGYSNLAEGGLIKNTHYGRIVWAKLQGFRHWPG